MTRIALLLVILLNLAAGALAQQPQLPFGDYINGLPQTGTMSGPDQFYILQGGVSKKIQAGTLSSIFGSGGGGGEAVNGVAALRFMPVVSNQTLFLNYHTSPGDLGFGLFVGVTGGTYVDDNGTVFVPGGGSGSAAWLRVWDHQNADMGWWGAKFDHVADDYVPWSQAIGLFTFGGACNGAYGSTVVNLDVHGGFNHSKPLVYSGCSSAGITITGTPGFAYGGFTAPYLNYTGPATVDQVIISAANGSYFKNMEFVQNLAHRGLHFLADNTFCNGAQCGVGVRNRITGTYSPGANVTIAIDSTYNMVAATGTSAGTQLGLGYGTSDFEIVHVTAINPGVSITVERLLNSHSSRELIGGGGASNFIGAENLWFSVTTIAGPTPNPYGAAIAIGNVITVATDEVADVQILHSGCGGLDQATFNGSISNGSGGAGTLLDITSGLAGTVKVGMYVVDSSGQARIYSPTKIVSQNSPTQFVVDTSQHFAVDGISVQSPAHNCIQQTEGGNTKNVVVNFFIYTFVEVPFNFLNGSGFVDLTEPQGSQAYDAVFLFGGANFNIYNFEDESPGMIYRAACGSNPVNINFFSGSYQSSIPNAGPTPFVVATGNCNTSLYGIQVFNGTPSTAIAGYGVPGQFRTVGYNYGSDDAAFTVLNSWFQHAADTIPFILDGSGNDMTNWYGVGASYQTATIKGIKLVMLNNLGGTQGSLKTLDNILPNARNMEQSPYSGSGQNAVQTATNPRSFSGAKNWARLSLPYTVWTATGANIDWDLFGLPAKTKLTAIYLDITQGFAGGGSVTCGPCTLQAGTSSGASDLINATTAAATRTLGLLAADVAGGKLDAANAVQGGWMNWASATDIWVRLHATGGNIGTGGGTPVTNLSAGNVDVYVQTERMTGPP